MVTALLISAVILSLRDFKLAFQEYEINLEQVRVNWEQQSEKDPHDAAHDGTYVIKPIHPLSIVDRGIKPFTGKVVHLGAHERKQSTLNDAKDRSGIFRFGELTPGFLMTYVFPLLFIFLGFNAFTEEKEKQTLRLLLVQGATGRDLAVGKWLALFVQVLMLWFLMFAALWVGIQCIGKDVNGHRVDLVNLSISYLLYFIIFINLVILVSSRASSSGAALTTLVGIWIMFVLLVPKVSTTLAGLSYPFPTLQTFVDNINQDQASGLNGHNFWNEAALEFKQEVLDQYGVATIEDLPIAYEGLLLAEGEKYESEIFTKHFDLLQDQYEKQRSIYRWCSFFSPMLAVRFVSMAISRVDYGFLWHFEDAAEKYRVEFNTALNMNIAENAKGVDRYQANQEVWAGIPRFEYVWQETDQILDDHLIDFMMIIFWTVFSFFVAIYFSNSIKVV